MLRPTRSRRGKPDAGPGRVRIQNLVFTNLERPGARRRAVQGSLAARARAVAAAGQDGSTEHKKERARISHLPTTPPVVKAGRTGHRENRVNLSKIRCGN